MKATFVAFDTETTGLEPESCDVIEVAGVKFRLNDDGGPELLGEYTSLIQIDGSIPARASEINHIYDNMLTNAPRPREAIGGFFRWVGASSIMVAHNASFDVSFLGNEIQKHGLMLPRNPIFCSRRMSCRLMPEIRHRLLDLEAHLILGNPEWIKHRSADGSHRALYDSRMLAFVFAALLKKGVSRENWEAEKLLKILPGMGGAGLRFDKPMNSHELSQQYLNMEKECR